MVFKVQGSGFRVQGSGFRVQGAKFRDQDSGLRAQASSFRVRFLFCQDLFILGTCYIKGPEGSVVMLLLCFHKFRPPRLDRSETHFAVGYKMIFGPILIELPASSPSDPPYVPDVLPNVGSYRRLATETGSISFTALRKDAGPCCGSRLRKGDRV